jgi:O-antigen ligase
VAGVDREYRGRASENRAAEWIFALLAAAVTWTGSESNQTGQISPWFRDTPLGVPLHYLLFGVLLGLLVPYIVSAPAYSLAYRLKQLGLWRILGVASIVIALAIAMGIFRGVPELFADWRNLLIASVTAIFAAKWLTIQSWKRFALTDLATVYGLLAIPHLIAYAAGSGASVLGVRTTVFDGPTLYLACFSAITAGWHALTADAWLAPRRVTFLRIAGVASSLLVLLSFRRSFWLTWVVGLATVAAIYVRMKRGGAIRVYAAILGFVVLVSTAIVAMGTDTTIARLQSFLPSDTGPYAATNADHFNDIVDAWNVIARDPILGLGIGTHYETELIADWKEESFEVHNAILHVWLKFGVAGALTYLAFHLALVRAAFRHRNTSMVPIGAFILAELIATMVGTWPYGSFKMSVFHGLLIAILAVNTETDTSLGVPKVAIPTGSRTFAELD